MTCRRGGPIADDADAALAMRLSAAEMAHLLLHDDGAPNGATMFIEPDRAGRIIEVGVIDTSAGPIIVHAMPARPKYLR